MSAPRESPHEYAARRARETGRPYLVSDQGHALVDCRANRVTLRALGLRVAHVARPRKYRLTP